MESCFNDICEKDLIGCVHLCGIGGVGMTALAEILLDLGIEVSGSDPTRTKNVDRLKQRGVTIYQSHKKEHVIDKFVCRSRAIKDHNEEIVFAKKSVFRSDLLAFLAKGKKQIVVTGSHGKTTVSTLLAHCMEKLGHDISFALGGFCSSLNRYGKIGSSEYFVIEGDESDGSHLKTNPYGAILTSVDVDHLAFWKTGKALQDSYFTFAKSVQNKSMFLFCADDEEILAKDMEGKSYGIKKHNQFHPEDIDLKFIKSTFKVNNQLITLPLFGEYNICNALSVYGILDAMDISHEEIDDCFKSFKGVHRRMEYLGCNVYSDYAHHPEEVKAVLSSMKKMGLSMKVVFEPHRISRFKDELEGFSSVMDNVIITDVFEASEDLNVDAMPILNEFCKRTNSTYLKTKQVLDLLKNSKEKILVLGAGPLDSKIRKQIPDCL